MPSKSRVDHKYVGQPNGICDKCGKAYFQHRTRRRQYHRAVGDPCDICGKPAAQHLSERALLRRKERDKGRKNREAARRIVGIDGEGMDTPDGRHIYTLLCAVDEYGRVVAEVENLQGLSTRECLSFFLKIPKNTLKFVFMGSYDWTKIIEELHPADRYYIMHPETRRKRYCKICKKVCAKTKMKCCKGEPTSTITLPRNISEDIHGVSLPFALDWFNGSFTVKGKLSKRTCKVWDCFKFFQSSFVKALKAWNVGTPEQIERISAMKEKRGSFDIEKPEDVRGYCREECHLLAVMMRKVLNACDLAGIELRRFDGAGAIASALLKMKGVKEYLGPKLEELPKELEHAVMSAYSGGRFENAVVGGIEKLVYNRDINSAYPYALSNLPCLACGKWKHVGKDVLRQARKASLGLVHFRIPSKTLAERQSIAWAPLPFRDEEGSICYPTGFEGWSWLPEIEAALKGWPDFEIEILDGFIYTTNCPHKPFAWLPEIYRKRFEWNKDTAGIVLKLGMNACAGKTMQSVGDNPPFKSWIWGGMLTAITRSQLLQAICTAKDRWNVLAVATDGMFTTEKLELPKPRVTGTEDLPKPLGNWGEDKHENGVFFVKPGMYFDDSKSLMRARGIGRKELDKNAKRLVRRFQKWDRKDALKTRVKSRRFFGARSSILAYSQCSNCRKGWPGVPNELCPKCKKIGDSFKTTMVKIRERGKGSRPAYGQWVARPIDIEFAYLPKREFVSKGKTYGRMRIRDMGGLSSLPYKPGRTTPEGMASRQATEEALEEPDWNDMDEEWE